jgi:hypothetical protein
VAQAHRSEAERKARKAAQTKESNRRAREAEGLNVTLIHYDPMSEEDR